MRFNRKRKANEVHKKLGVKLFNNITLNAMPREELREDLERYIALSSLTLLRRDLPRLLGKAPIIELLELYPASNDRLSGREVLVMGSLRCVELYDGLLRKEATALRTFWQLARKFESALLRGNFESASDILEEVEKEFGASLWLIRSRTILYASQGQMDELHEYTEKCKKNIKDGFSYFLVNMFLLLATDPLLHSKQTIASTIRELQAAGLKEWADLLKLLFIPAPNVRAGEQLDCIQLIKLYPIVDQLSLLGPYLANEACHRQLDAREMALHQVVKDITSDAEFANGITLSYEAGRYSDAIDEYFSSGDREVIHFSCIAAKAMQISGWQGNIPWRGALKDIIGSLRAIYALDKSPQQCRATLDAIVLQMHYLPSGALLQLLPYQAFASHLRSEDRALAARQLMQKDGARSPWISLLASAKDPILDNSYSTDQIPECRKLKQRIRDEYRERAGSGGLSSLLQDYEKIAPLKRDYYELASSIYLGLEDLGPLVRICAESISVNENSHCAFPLLQLMEFIERVSMCDVDSLVVIYSYVRNIDQSKDYILNEFYEEYLISVGVSRPSDVSVSGHDRDKRLLILRDISVPETIDFLTVFKSSSAIRAERLRILDILLKENAIDADRHRAEVAETLLQAVIDNGAAQFNAHKIFVNDVAIKRKISDEVSSLFKVYKASLETDAEKFIPFEAATGQEQAAAVVAGDKNTTLLKILSVANDAFLYDDKHGLDKNLSVEIRHGFFANKMRSKLEERSLITEKDEVGNYARNEYWAKVNALLTDEALDTIDECLRWFSSEFNALISMAESWMKVSTDHADTVRIFKYELYSDQFEPIRECAEEVSGHDELLERVFDLLWKQTEWHLDSMRSKIDNDLRHRVDSLFAGLISKLDEVRGQTPIAELMSSVNRTRNDMREDLTAIAEWFRKDDAVSVNARTLQEVVAISIECYNRLRGNQVRPTVESERDDIAIMLDGRQVRSFLVALMNIYENCIRHSGYGTDTAISVTISGSTRGWRIRISNPVTDDVFTRLNEGALRNARGRMNDAAFAGLVRTEGGSGLRKVRSQFSECSDGINVSIDAEDSDFLVVITNG